MNEQRWLNRSDRWFRVLLHFYPVDFREEMGQALVEAYRDRCREALRSGGVMSLMRVWLSALVDSMRNGPGERAHPAASWRRSGNWGRDMELATRRLVRAPLFVATMVGTLTIGLGAFAVVYTVVDKILLEPMPYRAPDDLYYVWRDYRAFFDLDRGWLAGTDVAELQKAGGVIEGAAAIQRSRFVMSGRDGMDATEIPVLQISPELFDLLGVRPALGRVFAPNEAGANRPRLIVLTHDLWTRLGGERAIIGSELRLNGLPFTVIGVLPRNFAFMRHSSLGAPQTGDAYITLPVNLAETNPGGGSYAGLIRVRPGTTPEVVDAAVTSVARLIDERDFQSRGLKLWAIGLKPDLVAGVRPALVVLALAGVFLMLVLLVNLATLLLARATQREQEFAVSRALGANRIALMRATLLEGALLGLLGGTAAALAATWGTRTLVALAPLDLPRREAIVVDWSIAAVVIGIGMLLGLLAALVPAIWAARTSLATLMSNAAVRGGGGHGRMRRGMVVVQIALTLVLLTTGGLVVRSFARLLRADPGFDPSGVLTVRVPLPIAVFPDSLRTIALQDEIIQALRSVPGVTAVGAADAVPLSASANQTSVQVPGAPGNTGVAEHDAPLVDYFGIRAGYIDAMGMRVLEGRGLDPVRRAGVYEALVDEAFAKHFLPTGSIVGTTMPFGDQTVQFVGVVQQARMYDVHEDGRPQLYLRAEDWGYRSLIYALRAERDLDAVIPEVRAAVRGVDPQLALAEMRPMDEIVGDALRQQRVSAVLVGGFALGALLLSAMGLFGVVSAAVTRRKHEIAVRLALGADHGGVLRLVVGEGAVLILLGVLIGAPATYFAGRAISGVLVGVSPSDPITLSSVSIGLAAVALAACYLPARRVLGIEPARSLRQE